jgi:hypothetical protein
MPVGHRTAELRSIAFHRVVAERLDEELLDAARRRVDGWLSAGGSSSRSRSPTSRAR